MSETLSPEEKAANDETWKHIHRVQQLLARMILELQVRLLAHDQSKLKQPEVGMFQKFTPRLAEMEYSADPESEYQQCLEEMKKTALKHHYDHNRHHPEHFGEDGVNGMDLLDLIEMICDWQAAGERHKDGGDLMRSIGINAERFKLSDQLVLILTNTAITMQTGPPTDFSI